MSWFRDGTKLVVSGPAGPADTRGVWVVSTLIGTIRKLRDDACGAAVSPDSSRIAFLNGKRNELWSMGANGEGARKIASMEQGYRFAEVAWSPDGQRIAYLKRERGDREYAVETRDLDGRHAMVILSDPRLRSFCWAADGRIIYSRMELSPAETNFNLWEIQTDPRSGRASGRPRAITGGPGHSFWYLSAAADASRVAFLRWQYHSDVWVGELEQNGTRLSATRRVTADDRADWPSAWTRDSQTLLFYSDRNGSFDLFKQGLGNRAPELAVFSPDEERWPQISPDGAWILYLAWPKTAAGAAPPSGRLMRIAISGGEPSAVLEVHGYPGLAQVKSEGRTRPTARGYPSFRCPSVKASSCLLAEEEGEQIVFSAIDPLGGRKGEVARLEVKPATDSFWDLSPDGTSIAFLEREEQRGPIRILPLAGRAAHEVPVKGWTHLDSVAWSADGRALFVTSYSPRGSSLLRVSLDGEVQLLKKSSMWLDTPVPSPDGRYLAFGQAVSQSNAWMMDWVRGPGR